MNVTLQKADTHMQTEVSFSSLKLGNRATMAPWRYLILQGGGRACLSPATATQNTMWAGYCAKQHWGMTVKRLVLPKPYCLPGSLGCTAGCSQGILMLLWGSMRKFEQLLFETGRFHGEGTEELWINTWHQHWFSF